MALRPMTADNPRLVTRPAGPVAMDLDDLRDLHQLLVDRTSGVVSIQVGRYEADDPTDFRQASDKDLMRIKVTTASPMVQAFLTPDVGRVWSQTDDAATTRLVEDAAELINGCRTRYSVIYPPIPAISLLIVVSLLTLLAVSAFAIGNSETGLIGVGLAAAMIGWWLYETPRNARSRGGVKIVPLSRDERRARSGNTRASVTIAILGAFIGGVLGILGTLIAAKAGN
ncbi:hypothetical protein E0H26_18580 [Micromonospora zingiberis]|uniref:Uncharacterized protein n=1 Tax=Micromonospora zingiberis TaxID=2053011 RepID=A0A4R0GK07_9ACTN|nr:hypothetical protein [Micromonospora zingiberis]TCB95809.1 hypothetical protein E0H26_18580 [Micromonospora zingiberis]